jgi:hypothetical protein
MKRTFTIAIFTAAVVGAVCLTSQGQSNVYSLNVGSFIIRGSHLGVTLGSFHGFNSPVGPLGISEMSYWTDSAGQQLGWNPDREDQPSDRLHRYTRVSLGRAAFSLPLGLRAAVAFLSFCGFTAVVTVIKGVIHSRHDAYRS